ncbi:hypothetical protein C8Q79DRAFT_984553 [Trametes meyenii]|nr:hypothetical protein C8Q79DRAFT_984553 [Trametes meyenii]
MPSSTMLPRLLNGGSWHPYFVEPSADIVFCSSNKIHFKLHKILLSLASPFFTDMFNLPQPTLSTSHAPGPIDESDPNQIGDTEVDTRPDAV